MIPRSLIAKPTLLLLTSLALFAGLLITNLSFVTQIFRENQNFRDVLNFYLATDISTSQRESLLHAIWQRSCILYEWDECNTSAILAPSQMLEVVDNNLFHPLTPLILVDSNQNQKLNWNFFRIGGVSVANQDVSAQQSAEADDITLWGSGYIEGRLFLFSPKRGQIVIDAVHDAPPPVILDVELRNVAAVTLAYDKGDQSWESKSTPFTLIPSGYSVLRVWYVNDYFDSVLGLDRNAKIRSISISTSSD